MLRRLSAIQINGNITQLCMGDGHMTVNNYHAAGLAEDGGGSKGSEAVAPTERKQGKSVPAEGGEATEKKQGNSVPQKFADLFKPEKFDRIKKDYNAVVRPLIEQAQPGIDFEHVVTFKPLQYHPDGTVVKCDEVYKAFGSLRPYLIDSIGKGNYAQWLADHVEGKSSAASWGRCM